MKFAIVANGFADGPAQALRDYLLARDADVVTVFHPLSSEQGTTHVIAEYANGRRASERRVHVPLRPPGSFAVDPFVPLLPSRVDAWFGFNPSACARGLLARRQGRAPFVALWSVDFVPNRFGPGTILTRIYDRLDRLCCEHADARIELSAAARDARNARHGLPPNGAHVVPMGAWIDRVPTTSADAFEERRVAFLGHLVERQGVDTLLGAIALTPDVRAEIVGGGPLEAELRRRAATLAIEGRVTFHGYVGDHRDVERILARCAIAAAPYKRRVGTFTPYADPGKLKAYVAAGLPIVLTDVPPTASELAREAGAQIVDDDAQAVAAALARGLASREEWQARRESALAYARLFDWNRLLGELLTKLRLGP